MDCDEDMFADPIGHAAAATPVAKKTAAEPQYRKLGSSKPISPASAARAATASAAAATVTTHAPKGAGRRKRSAATASKKQAAEATAAQSKAQMREKITTFKREMGTFISRLRTAHQNRERDIEVRLSVDEQRLRRDQQRAALITAKHASLLNSVHKQLKNLPVKKAKKYTHLRDSLIKLSQSMQTLAEDTALTQQLHAERLKMRREDLKVLRKGETDVLRLRTAMMVQLDQLIDVEVPQAAAQPWSVSGFGGRFMRAVMELPATRPGRSYRSKIVGDLEDPVDEQNEAAARELTELEDLERSTRAPPPAGFMTDIISQRYYALMARQTASNQEQHLGISVIDAMPARNPESAAVPPAPMAHFGSSVYANAIVMPSRTAAEEAATAAAAAVAIPTLSTVQAMNIVK